MFVILRPLRLLLKALTTESTPRQMSLGLAFGVLVGLVPKGNLLAVGLATLLAATRVNLAVAAAATVAVSFASIFADRWLDQLGYAVLTLPELQSLWTSLADMPFVPWTDFNNTIVMGSCVSGLVLFWPVHRMSRPVFERFSKSLGERARRWWLARVLLGAEWADRISSADAV